MLFMCTLKKINLGYLILFLTKMSKYAEGRKLYLLRFYTLNVVAIGYMYMYSDNNNGRNIKRLFTGYYRTIAS